MSRAATGGYTGGVYRQITRRVNRDAINPCSGSARSGRHKQAMQHSLVREKGDHRFDYPRLSDTALSSNELTELRRALIASM